jgi:transposase
MRYWAGIDVAKDIHWLCVIDENASVLIDRALTNTQDDVDAAIVELQQLDGELAIGLDVMGSIASFLEATLIAAGLKLVHVPGMAVNRARDGFANSEAKSDPKDARVIAEQVRTRPNLRHISLGDETTAAIRVLVSRRRDLVQDQTRRIARLRSMVGSIHPGLERALDFTTVGPLHFLTRFVTPAEICKAGLKGLMAHLKARSGLRRAGLAEVALNSAKAQHTVVVGEAAIADIARELAAEALAVKDRLARLEDDLEALLARHPDAALIRSLPGMGVILTAEFIAAVGDIDRFKTADAMAAAAGLAPVIRQSGRSRNWRRTYGGDKELKRVFFQGAFCAFQRDPISRAFYARKRREGKHHTQALIALARRRVTVLWAMLKTQSKFDPRRALAA